MRTKEEFVTNLEHEVRTPLTAMCGMIEQLANREDLKEDQSIKNLEITSKYLKGLMKDLLDWSQVESNQMILSVKAFELSELLEYVHAVIEPLAIEKGISFKVTKRSTVLYRYFYQDAIKLKQVLTNLLTNAIKATSFGGTVDLNITCRQIEINRVEIQFLVEDTGKGMAPDFLFRALEPFSQESDAKSQEGFGLGLYITKQIVDKLEGKIHINSVQKIGTKVWVTFEVDGADEYYEKREPEWTTSIQEGHLLEQLRGKRILIAEDNEMIMQVFTDLFEKCGVLVDKTYDGNEVLDIFEQSDNGYYQMILMDMVMPDKNGVEATKEIRKLERDDAVSIPIIAVSGKGRSQEIERAIEAGMDDYLQKPFEYREVMELFRRYLL